MAYDKSDFDLIATVYTEADSGDTVADGDWDYTGARYTYHDINPYDIMGVSWETGDYDFNSGTEYKGGNTTEHRSTGFDGVSFNIDDAEVKASGSSDSYGWGGIYLTGTEDIENRKIIVNYTHTWSTTEVTSVGFNSNGTMTVGLSSGGNKWSSPLQAFDDDNKQL